MKNFRMYKLPWTHSDSEQETLRLELFFKIIILLSGDINFHPGSIQNPCKLRSKSVKQKIIFCQKFNFWFHKIYGIQEDKSLYNELKLYKNIVYLWREFSKCSNDSISNNVQFFGENFLEGNFDMSSGYKVF